MNIELRAWDTNTHSWVEAITLTLHTSGRLINVPPNILLTLWTGLYDKHGKKIYDGDIVKCLDGYQATVSYDEKRAQFDPFGSYEGAEWGDSVEVIGNIHENPDLLT